MELGGQRAPELERLRALLVARQLDRARRDDAHVVVPLHPRPRADRGHVALDLEPADLLAGASLGTPAERGRHDLRAEADAEQRQTRLVRPADELDLRLDRWRHVVPVHAPVGAEEQDEVEPTELRPGPRILPCRHRQHEPVVAQAFADDPRISVVAVGDHERAHDRYGTPGW